MTAGRTNLPGPIGLVLAAGASERMGRPKALLQGPRGSFLRTVLALLEEVGVQRARVILGPPHGEEILAREPPDRLPLTPEVVMNPSPERGMLSSLQVGIVDLTAGAPPSILVWPVDHPLVTASTVSQLIEGLAGGAPIVLPVHLGMRGHPVAFAGRLLPELMAASLEIGARQVVRAHARELVEIAVEDTGVVRGIDAPSDYDRFMPPRSTG